MDLNTIKLQYIGSEDEARQIAIDWQNSFQEAEYDTQDLMDWAAYFEKLGKQFDLTDEFKENGII